MLGSITVLAPAKINLGLKVFPRRADGYHDIQSVFTTVNLFDTLTVSVTEEKLKCEVICLQMKLPEENTFTASYKAFCVLTGIQEGVRVEVQKRIPAGGGLGGGSSDASSFIQSLDCLFGTHLSDDDLAFLAGKVGSDVFFFTHALAADGKKRFSVYEPYAAVVEGRGEIVKQIDARNDFCVLLVFPGVSVSTKDAYSLVDQWYIKNKIHCGSCEAFELEKIYRKDVKDWTFVNDFTSPVCSEYSSVAEALAFLNNASAAFADMSGSGSTVFGVFKNRNDALEAQKKLNGKFQSVIS